MRALLAALPLLLVACGTTPTPTESAGPPETILAPEAVLPSAGPARVLVKRDSGFVAAACRHVVMLDGRPIAQLLHGQAVTIHTQPGRHIVGVKATPFLCGNPIIETEVVADAARPTVLRISTDSAGSIKLSPTAY
jgi:hypothetical protein